MNTGYREISGWLYIWQEVGLHLRPFGGEITHFAHNSLNDVKTDHNILVRMNQETYERYCIQERIGVSLAY